MPELPEIAILKKYVDSTSLKKKVITINHLQTSLLQAPKKDFENFKGKAFRETQQLGKYLFLKAEEDLWLGFHFGMTGTLEYYNHEEHPKYTHIVLTFEDGSHLAYVCRRKLGKIYLSNSVEDFKKSHSLGKHALELDLKEFREILEGKKSMIKTVLTDQHELSGIGNVYADEILYQCKIHPKSGTDHLSEKEVENIFSKMKQILKAAIESGGKGAELPSHYLVSHRKAGADCPNCKGKVEKTTVSGRSTYFCPSCQEEK